MSSGSESTRGARGGAITLFGQGTKALLQVLSVVLLSRLLGPDDFGLIAMVTVALSFGELVLDFGLTAAALRERVLSNKQASNLFWINAALGLFLCIAMVSAAPLIAEIYSDSRLVPIAQVAGVALLFRGLQAQLQVQLARRHRYFTLAITDVGSHLSGFILAMCGALMGVGYWALVWQVVGLSVVLFLSRFVLCRWLPELPSGNTSTFAIVRSGISYAASQVLTFAASNVDSFVVGARFGSVTLGYYNRALQVMTVPLTQLLSPLTVVAIPSLTDAKNRHPDSSLDPLLLRLQTLVALPIAVMFGVAAGSAGALVPVVLGEQWSASVFLFQILAIAGVLRSLSHINYWMFLVLARSIELLKVNVVTKLLTVVAVVAASSVSVEAVAAAYVTSLAVNWPINLCWLKKTSGISWMAYLVDGARFLLIGSVVACASFLGSFLPIANTIVMAFVQIALGVVAFILLLLIVPIVRKDFEVIVSTARMVIPSRP